METYEGREGMPPIFWSVKHKAYYYEGDIKFCDGCKNPIEGIMLVVFSNPMRDLREYRFFCGACMKVADKLRDIGHKILCFVDEALPSDARPAVFERPSLQGYSGNVDVKTIDKTKYAGRPEGSWVDYDVSGNAVLPKIGKGVDVLEEEKRDRLLSVDEADNLLEGLKNAVPYEEKPKLEQKEEEEK